MLHKMEVGVEGLPVQQAVETHVSEWLVGELVTTWLVEASLLTLLDQNLIFQHSEAMSPLSKTKAYK